VTPAIRAAAVLMVAALGFYSTGVWSERLAARLKPWHLAMFWLGFACDTAGTERMRRIAGVFRFTFHGTTGIIALLLMLAHALWATLVLVRRDEKAIRTFHRVSVVVWTVWLVPFLTGPLFD